MIELSIMLFDSLKQTDLHRFEVNIAKYCENSVFTAGHVVGILYVYIDTFNWDNLFENDSIHKYVYNTNIC